MVHLLKKKTKAKKSVKKTSDKKKIKYYKVPLVLSIPSNAGSITFTEKQLAAFRNAEKSYEKSKGIRIMAGPCDTPTGCARSTSYETVNPNGPITHTDYEVDNYVDHKNDC